VQAKNMHGLAPLGQQEPAPHCNTIYKNHKGHFQLCGGISFCFITGNAIRFYSDLLVAKAQNFQQTARKSADLSLIFVLLFLAPVNPVLPLILPQQEAVQQQLTAAAHFVFLCNK
jgi:hypothetical protein